jgi:hypothetical protein
MSSWKELVSDYFRDKPDWNNINSFVESNPSSIEETIDKDGYLLHHAYWKNAPSNFIINQIKDSRRVYDQK